MSKGNEAILRLIEKGYFMSKDGKLINPKGEIVKGRVNSVGYLSSSVQLKYCKINAAHHRIQAYQKYGDKVFEKGIVCRHLDEIKLNNSCKNIAIGSCFDNSMDTPKILRQLRALNGIVAMAKKNKKYDYEKVVVFYQGVKSYKKTMDEFGIKSKGTLNYILKTYIPD